MSKLDNMSREEMEDYVRSTGCRHIQGVLSRHDLSIVSDDVLRTVAETVESGEEGGYEAAPVATGPKRDYCVTAANSFSSGFLYIGNRSGEPIDVTAQLQRINAGEQLLMELFPRIHEVIRGIYDRIGPKVAAYIDSPGKARAARATLKPIEYLSLLALVLLDPNHKERLNSQYR